MVVHSDAEDWLQALTRGLDPLAWWAQLTGHGGFRQQGMVRVAIELASGPRDSLAAAMRNLGVSVSELHEPGLSSPEPACITARVPLEQLRALAALPGVSRVMPGFIGGEAGRGGEGPALALRRLRAPPPERAALIHRLRRVLAHGRSRRVVDGITLPSTAWRRSGPVAAGTGPLIGIIDFGCAFLHPSLSRRMDDGTCSTRILALWDQGRRSDEIAEREAAWPWTTGHDAGYGRVATREKLDALSRSALELGRKKDPSLRADHWSVHEVCYAAAEMPELLQPGCHGTAVATLAAADNDADLLFVQLPQDAIDDWSGGWLTPYLVDALAWLQQQARALGRPLVVNLSVGTHAGPHDGSSILERELERHAREHLLVLAAGNAAGRRGHARATLAAHSDAELHWMLPPGDPTQSFCEVWYDLPPGCEPPRFTLEHDAVTASEAHDRAGATLVVLRDAAGTLAAACAHVPPGQGTRSGRFWIALAPTHPRRLEPGPGGETASAPSGRWRLTAHNPAAEAIELHAWVERDEPGTRPLADRPDSVLTAPVRSPWAVSDEATLTAQASARGVLAVGGTVRGAEAGTPLRESGRGPTRDGRVGVACWAHADDRVRGLDRGWPVMGNHSGPDAPGPEAVLRWRGTSLAAPQVVARAVALMTQRPGLAKPAEVIQALGLPPGDA